MPVPQESDGLTDSSRILLLLALMHFLDRHARTEGVLGRFVQDPGVVAVEVNDKRRRLEQAGRVAHENSSWEVSNWKSVASLTVTFLLFFAGDTAASDEGVDDRLTVTGNRIVALGLLRRRAD
jgi:hypothetical protein